MTMTQLVRQIRAPRRQIASVLVITLVASIGLFVGTKLQPESTTPPVPVYEAPPRVGDPPASSSKRSPRDS